MILSQNGFWAWLYRFTRNMVCDFANVPPFPSSRRLENTDLCTFVRTIFIWFPIVLVLNFITIGAVVVTLFTAVKAIYLNSLSFIFIVGGIVAVIAGVVLGIAAIVWFHKKAKNAIQGETVQLAVAYLEAKKQVICPMIRIGE